MGIFISLALVVKFRQREVCCSQMSGINRFRQEIRTVSHENKSHVLKSSIFQIILRIDYCIELELFRCLILTEVFCPSKV
jgi:hypothetical protein